MVTLSHPMWVRGLKPVGFIMSKGSIKSHPMWVRGLKLYSMLYMEHLIYVAPYVGAWIETK